MARLKGGKCSPSSETEEVKTVRKTGINEIVLRKCVLNIRRML